MSKHYIIGETFPHHITQLLTIKNHQQTTFAQCQDGQWCAQNVMRFNDYDINCRLSK